MGSWGAIIMGSFGAVFAALTMATERGTVGVMLALPFFVAIAIIVAAVVVLRRPGARIAPTQRAERIITWSTIGEGVGLFVGGNLVENLGHPEWLLPTLALVVGLHFLPMGLGIPFRPFLLLGSALVAAACLGYAIGRPLGTQLAGFAASLSLWIAAALAVVRDARSRAATGT